MRLIERVCRVGVSMPERGRTRARSAEVGSLKMSRAAAAPLVLLSLLAPLPAFAALPAELMTKLRTVPTGVLLAQMGDIEVFFDQRGRRILLDSRTGAVIAVEPPRRASRAMREWVPGQLRGERPDRRKRRASSRQGTKPPAQFQASAPDQPSAKSAAPKRQRSADRRAPAPAATIESPEYYDFQPEPLFPVAFDELKRVAAPLAAAPRSEKASTEPVMNTGQQTDLPATTPPVTVIVRRVGSSLSAMPSTLPAQVNSADAKQTVDGKADQTVSADQGPITGSVRSAKPADGSGKGVAQNEPEKEGAVRTAAEKGDPKAQLMLANMYRGGKGVSKDDAAAAKWFREAAARGDAEAQFDLGPRYQEGEGVLQDYVFAHMWFNLSAAQGYEPAKKARGGLANRMSQDQVAEAQRMAREWKPFRQAGVR